MLRSKWMVLRPESEFHIPNADTTGLFSAHFITLTGSRSTTSFGGDERWIAAGAATPKSADEGEVEEVDATDAAPSS